MSKAKKLAPVERLMAAMDRCALSRGEAMYTMGYRAGRGEPEESRLYPKMTRQFEQNGRMEKAFRRLAVKLLREAAKPARRASGPAHKGRADG